MTKVNGKGITFKHEGAGINYAFVSDSSAKFSYDDESNICSTQLTLKLATTLVLRETLFNFQSLLHLLLKSVMMVL